MHPFFNHFFAAMHERHHHGHGHGHSEGHRGRHGRHHAGGFRFDFGDGFPGEGRGASRGGRGGGMGPGRKLGSADLQLLILALLAEKPRHGYEIIKALDERSNGYYSPSPGMVYPALTYLEEIGHATQVADGAKKLYSITEAGLTHLEQNRAAVDTLLEQLAFIGRKMEHMRRAMSGSDGDLNDDGLGSHDGRHGRHEGRGERTGRGERGERGHHDRHEAWHEMAAGLRQARHNLKSALIEKFGASAEEQARVAGILERAASEIRGK